MSIPALQDFGFDAEHQVIFDTAYRYAREHLYPLAPRMDREDWFPEEAFRALGAQGLLGVTVPPAFGGAGLGVLAQCFVCEAISYWNHAFAASMLASGVSWSSTRARWAMCTSYMLSVPSARLCSRL